MSYKVVVTVTSKRARLVPTRAYRPTTAERDFGEIPEDIALNNREELDAGIRSLLEDNGIKDANLYTVELPDNLRPLAPAEQKQEDKKREAADKGPVTKPKSEDKKDQNPKVDPKDEAKDENKTKAAEKKDA